MIGLGIKLGDALTQRDKVKCERCRLFYPKDDAKCIHCSHMSEADLQEFKENLLVQDESHRRLGIKLIFSAIVVALFLVLIVLILRLNSNYPV